MSDNRPPVYREGDTIVFRASGVGGAEKPLIAMLMGFDPSPPPPNLQRAFDFGIEHEDELRSAWLHSHPEYELVSDQEVVEYWVGDNIVVRGHGDGVVRNKLTGDLWVLELKWLGKTLFGIVDRKGTEGLFDKLRSYEDQVAVYSAGYGSTYDLPPLPVFYVCGNKAVYQDSGGDIEFHEEELDDVAAFETVLGSMKDRVAYIVERAEEQNLPVECDCTSWCPTYYLHEDLDSLVDGEEGKRLTDLAIEYADLKLESELLDLRIKQIKDELRRELAELGVDKAETWGARVTWVRQERSSLDKQAMEDDGIDLSKYTKKVPREYLRITAKDMG